MANIIRISHRPSGVVVAEGPLGWGVTSFDGAFYIQSRYLREGNFTSRWVPGVCFYKFLYVWLDWQHAGVERVRMGAWRYVIPNPLLPFIWWRVAIPQSHRDWTIERLDDPTHSLASPKT